MGLDLYMHGIIEHSKNYKEMKTILETCDRLNIAVPPEVDDYFDSREYYGEDEVISLSEFAKETFDNDEYAISIDVADIPKNVKTIRVTYS